MTRSLDSEGVPTADQRTDLQSTRVQPQPKHEVLEEWQLVRNAQQYDEDALRQLYERYYPKVCNYAFLQMGDLDPMSPFVRGIRMSDLALQLGG